MFGLRLQKLPKVGSFSFYASLHSEKLTTPSFLKNKNALSFTLGSSKLQFRPFSQVSNTENESLEAKFQLKKEFKTLFKQKDYSTAMEKCNSELQKDPKNYDALSTKGYILFKLRKLEESLPFFDESIKLNPSYKFSWYNKGRVLYTLGKYEEAIECYNQAITLDPKSKFFWFSKGSALAKQRKDQEAILCFNQVLELDSNYKYAWIGKGYSLLNLDKNQEARECFERSSSIERIPKEY